MASRVKDGNYYQICGWMLNRLELKGVALQIYAIIYGFSQDGESEFTGSLQYLVDFTNTSKNTVIKALKELVDDGYIIKTEKRINGVQFNSYKVSAQVVQKLNWGSAETEPGGSAETAPNNIPLDIRALNKKGIRIDYQRIADMFNEICISYPRVKSLSDARKKAIKARFATYREEDFRLLFTKAEASAFLKGKNKRNWRATFDWLISDGNMAKVIDGNYDDEGGAAYGSGGENHGTAQFHGNVI